MSVGEIGAGYLNVVPVAGTLQLKLEAFPREAVSGAALSCKIFSQSGGTLGRVVDNDWVLDDAYLSRRHAEFRFIGGYFCVIDQGSTGGTRVGDKRPIEAGVAHRLKSGDKLLIGSFEIHVLIYPAVTEALTASVTPAVPKLRLAVEMTIFGPGIVTRRQPFVLRAVFHPAGREAEARALAGAPGQGLQAPQGLGSPGQLSESESDSITVRLWGEPRVSIDAAEQRLQWQGDLVAKQFEVRLPRFDWRSEFSFRVDVDVAGCPIGRCKFRVKLEGDARPNEQPAAYGALDRYRRVFLSYASEDAPMVAELAQRLAVLGMTYFLDTLSVRAGSEGRSEPRRYIEGSDLFLLCWSQNAAKSEWVAEEIALALSTQRQHGGLRPDIRQFVLDGPAQIAPPAALQHLHFSGPDRHLGSAATSSPPASD